MPAKNDDLHGNVPDDSAVVLLLVDLLNDLEFDQAEKLEPQARRIVPALSRLLARARAQRVPVVYVNDNHGRWRSDRAALLEHVRGSRGAFLAEAFAPEEDDYFVLKPKHSGFHATTLETVLRYLKAQALVIAGLTTDRCVLFTANDGFLRDYHLVVPEDCVTAIETRDHEEALALMRRVLHADVRRSDEIDFGALVRKSGRESGNPDAFPGG